VARFLALFCLVASTLQAQTVPPSGTVRGDVGTRIDQHLAAAERFGFSGAILVEHDGQVVLHKGYGLSDRENGIRTTAETVFDIGSITKPFTAAAILKLEEQGRLRVSDSITRYFKNVPADKAGITIHHLLTHTSGLRGDFGGDYDVVTRDSLVHLALASKLNAAPGADYDYSNAGFSLLGAIVEQVSGRSYEEFLREQLLKPAGLLNTGYRLGDVAKKPLAVGYRAGTRWGTPLEKPWAADGPHWNLRANGGLLSTVGDLYRWQVALESARVLSQTSFVKATTPPANSEYGYGLDVSTTPRGTRHIGHNGANGYFYARMASFPDEKVKLLFATNDHSNRSIENDVIAMLFGGDVREIPRATDASVALARYAGRYRSDNGTEFDVAVVGERLEIGRLPAEIAGALVLASRAPEAHRLPATFDSAVVHTIKGIAAGDFSSYRTHYLPFRNYKIDGEVEFWSSVFKDWRESLGSYRGARVLGVHTSGTTQDPVLTTYVTVQFANGERVVRVIQPLPRSEKFFLGTTSPAQWPSRLLFSPRTSTDFATYSLELSRGGPVRFELSEDGRVRGVVLPNGMRIVKAQ
jgi:CubicO group peptidase (beta-lactamase class C family)